MKILWVENHELFARIALKQFLSAHTVTVVPSLLAARFALSNSDFAILLIDYDLDDGKGVELVAELRSQNNNIGVIATSSHERGNSLLLAAGANAICSKLEFKDIARNIAGVLGK